MKFTESVSAEILDSISEGIFTVDKDFKISFFNKAAERITGYSRTEVIGKYCKNIYKSKACNYQCPIAQILETGKNIDGLDSTILNKNGQEIHLRMNAAILRNGVEEPTGGVISFRDVSYLEVLKKNLRSSNQFYGVVGHSKVMRELFDLIEEICDSDAAVLIQGPSGTGKEMIANAIQASSQRKKTAYIKVNCSVFSPQLLASELFGHVKGAYTGADRNRPGRFELANNGTIFLDEVAEMPLQMQIQLLRVLQEGTFERVGESVTRKVDIRVIAATNKDLSKALKEGSFREDLFYRLNVIPIVIPPLIERVEDIPHLVQHFIRKYALISKKEISDIDDDALDALLRYPWPGNVRELENAIEYAFARTVKQPTLRLCKLPANIRNSDSYSFHESPIKIPRSEYAHIMDLLEKDQGSQ
jgi:PAS domain S-box-containing protein